MMLCDPKWENEVLRDLMIAQQLLLDPKKWCRDGWGDGGNRGMCIAHAICAARGEQYDGGEAQGFITKLAGVHHIGDFNDRATHAEAMALFDRAIALQREKLFA